MVQITELATDPNVAIYPVGDEDNPDCPGCGMAGMYSEAVGADPVPGERFTLEGCFDEEACIEAYGPGGCRNIGSALFQTVGFMGGTVKEVSDLSKADSYKAIKEQIQAILNANSDKNFVKRLLNVNPNTYPVYDFGDGVWGSHLMNWSDFEDGYIIYPQLVCNDLKTCTELVLLSPYDAYNFAIEHDEYIKFSDQAFGDLFGENYKVVWGDSYEFHTPYGIEKGSAGKDFYGVLFPGTYLIDCDGEDVSAWPTDFTKYDIGQYVALAKVGTEFPLTIYEQPDVVTNINVPTVAEYTITPYQFAGEL